MAEEKEQKTDWIYLPPDVEELSLWSCLHDGELISCTSDSNDEYRVVLEFSVGHLLNEDDEGLTFPITMDGVTSVRATVNIHPAEKLIVPENTSREQHGKLIAEYHSKWREESFSWAEFETALATDPLRILNAGFVSKNNEATLRLGGILNGEKFNNIYCEVFMRGRSLSVSRSDGKDFNLDAFIDLGRDYWKNF
jgi:hypothetical protein